MPTCKEDDLSLTAYSQTASVDAKTWTTAYSKAQNRVTVTSALNRQSVTTLSAKGVPLTAQVPGNLRASSRSRATTGTTGS